MIIALTGGIGSGKSVVATMLTIMGYSVYDCDSRAKALMDSSDEIKRTIAQDICAEAITPEGNIDRRRLSAEVFSDAEKLSRLNLIVHKEVRKDMMRWIASQDKLKPCFVETAILYQSGLDLVVDKVWEVTADTETRICRVMKRNSMERQQVVDRIKSQNSFKCERRHSDVSTIINDGITPVLPRVEALFKDL